MKYFVISLIVISTCNPTSKKRISIKDFGHSDSIKITNEMIKEIYGDLDTVCPDRSFKKGGKSIQLEVESAILQKKMGAIGDTVIIQNGKSLDTVIIKDVIY